MLETGNGVSHVTPTDATRCNLTELWRVIEAPEPTLTSLTASPTFLLWKNSGRSGMDLHVPRELMYFSLYLTWVTKKEIKKLNHNKCIFFF